MARGRRGRHVRAPRSRARRKYRQRTLRLYGIPESEIAETLRAAEAARPGLDGLEITTCLRRGELEVVTRYEPAARGGLRRLRGGRPRAPRATRCSRRTARRSTSRSRPCCATAAATIATAESCTGGLLAGAPDRPGGLVGLRPRRPRRVLERGEDGARGRAGGPDRRASAPCRSRSPRRSPTARGRALGADVGVGITGVAGPGGGTRDEAGRARLLLGRRAATGGGSRARRGCRAGAPTSATARRRSRCTSSGGCCAGETDDRGAPDRGGRVSARLFAALDLPGAGARRARRVRARRGGRRLRAPRRPRRRAARHARVPRASRARRHRAGGARPCGPWPRRWPTSRSATPCGSRRGARTC